MKCNNEILFGDSLISFLFYPSGAPHRDTPVLYYVLECTDIIQCKNVIETPRWMCIYVIPWCL